MTGGELMMLAAILVGGGRLIYVLLNRQRDEKY